MSVAAWRRLTGALALIAITAAVPVSLTAQVPSGSADALTTSELAMRLDSLSQALQSAHDQRTSPPPSSQIPPSWRVVDDRRSFEISTEPLRAGLDIAARAGQDPARLEPPIAWIKALRAELEAFSAPAPASADARRLLDAVLADPEFNNVERPGPFDALRDRVLRWLAGLLGRLVESSSIPTIRDGLVYALIAVAIAAVAFWFYRSLRRVVTLASIGAAPPAPPRNWSTWWTEAQAAAADGRWRDGVHGAYWCAIAFLESRGAWRPDRARTPRDYLRLLSANREAGAPLTNLTDQFERVWYGNRPADAATFAEASDSLRKIGCPPS